MVFDYDKYNKEQAFIRQVKELRDARDEKLRVLDSTIYKDITTQELRRERRKARDQIIDETELEVDLLRVHYGLSSD